jgi:beta-glucosidase-like glycosyl hydrolase
MARCVDCFFVSVSVSGSFAAAAAAQPCRMLLWSLSPIRTIQQRADATTCSRPLDSTICTPPRPLDVTSPALTHAHLTTPTQRQVPLTRLSDMATRMVEPMIALGLISDAVDSSIHNITTIASSTSHTDFAAEIASQSLVMLKNKV